MKTFLSHFAAVVLAVAPLPCGAALNSKVGVGSGPSTPFALERPAPASAVLFTGSQSIDAPEVTLNPAGDWSIFVATIAPEGNNSSGTVLCIGAQSDTIFKDSGNLSVTWCAPWPKPWKQGFFGGSFIVTAKDDNGTSASARIVNNDTFFGVPGVRPLVGQSGFADGKPHGLVVQCRGGVIEFWSVEDAGARLMDSGKIGSHFAGITGRALRLGAASMKTQPSNPGTYWSQKVQALVIYNGGCLTPVQMKRLFSGAHAQDVLKLDPSRDDRYYPGTITNGKLDELVSGKSGIVTGSLATGPSILPTAVSDDVIVDMDGFGQVLPRDPAPAATTKARFWGTRVGKPTDIRLRVVKWAAPPSPIGADVVVDWVTVATGVGNGQTWIGDIPGVPHTFANYDCEVSWKDERGNWTPAKRLNRRWSVGVVVGIGGQSIVQKMRDDGGTARSFDPKVIGFLRGYYNMSQGSFGYQDNTQAQGWRIRYTPAAPRTYGGNFGELRMAEKLALLADCPVGIGNFAIGGSPIANFLGNTDQWSRWKLFIQRNRPQVAVWGNGQGDVALAKAQRFAALDRLLAQYDDAVQTAPGGPWNYRFYVFPINGDWGCGGNVDGIRDFDAEWAISRAAQGKPTGVACFVVDNATLDGTHLADNDTGLGILASRMAQTIANGLGLTPYSGLGPQVDRQTSKWSVAGGVTNADLVLTQNGGTGLATTTGSGPSGFQISIDGGPYAAPASAAIVDATHIKLTSKTLATRSVSVTYLAGAPGPNGKSTTKAQAGIDNAVYDNRGDSISGLPGFPLEPIPFANPLVLSR